MENSEKGEQQQTEQEQKGERTEEVIELRLFPLEEEGSGTNCIPTSKSFSPSLPDSQSVCSVAAGHGVVLVLSSEGKVYELEDPDEDDPDSDYAFSIVGFPHKEKVVLMTASVNAAMFTTQNDNVYAWGANTHGQLGRLPQVHPHFQMPTRIESLSKQLMSSISLGLRCGGAVTRRGRVWMWGDNTCGQVGMKGSNKPVAEPSMLQMFGVNLRAVQISCPFRHVLVLTKDGNVFSWGDAEMCGMGEDSGIIRAPRRMLFFEGNPVLTISSSSTHSSVVTLDGEVYSWGSIYEDQTKLARAPKRLQFEDAKHDPFLFISCLDRWTLAVTENDQAFTWSSLQSPKRFEGLGPTARLKMFSISPRLAAFVVIRDVSKRRVILRQMFNAEREYGSRLSAALRLFAYPLLSSADTSVLCSEEASLIPQISQEAVDCLGLTSNLKLKYHEILPLFGNLRQLFSFHTNLCFSLYKRLVESCLINIEDLRPMKTLTRFRIDALGALYQDYYRAYPVMTQRACTLAKENKKFAEFLDDVGNLLVAESHFRHFDDFSRRGRRESYFTLITVPLTRPKGFLYSVVAYLKALSPDGEEKRCLNPLVQKLLMNINRLKLDKSQLSKLDQKGEGNSEEMDVILSDALYPPVSFHVYDSDFEKHLKGRSQFIITKDSLLVEFSSGKGSSYFQSYNWERVWFLPEKKEGAPAGGKGKSKNQWLLQVVIFEPLAPVNKLLCSKWTGVCWEHTYASRIFEVEGRPSLSAKGEEKGEGAAENPKYFRKLVGECTNTETSLFLHRSVSHMINRYSSLQKISKDFFVRRSVYLFSPHAWRVFGLLLPYPLGQEGDIADICVGDHDIAILTFSGSVYIMALGSQEGQHADQSSEEPPQRVPLPHGVQIVSISLCKKELFLLGSNGVIYLFSRKGEEDEESDSEASFDEKAIEEKPGNLMGRKKKKKGLMKVSNAPDAKIIWKTGKEKGGKDGKEGKEEMRGDVGDEKPKDKPEDKSGETIGEGSEAGKEEVEEQKDQEEKGEDKVEEVLECDAGFTSVVSACRDIPTCTYFAASVSKFYACLDKAGALYMWGNRSFCGGGPSLHIKDTTTPSRVVFPDHSPGQPRIINVSVGTYHTVCLSSAGVAYSWGSPHSKEVLGHGSQHTSVPKKIKIPKDELVSQIACGARSTALITASGLLYMCGATELTAQKKEKFGEMSGELEKVKGIKEAVQSVVCGHSYTLAVSSVGSVFVWGSNRSIFEVGVSFGPNVPFTAPIQVPFFQTRDVVKASAGKHCCAVLSTDVYRRPTSAINDFEHEKQKALKMQSLLRLISENKPGMWYDSSLVNCGSLPMPFLRFYSFNEFEGDQALSMPSAEMKLPKSKNVPTFLKSGSLGTKNARAAQADQKKSNEQQREVPARFPPSNHLLSLHAGMKGKDMEALLIEASLDQQAVVVSKPGNIFQIPVPASSDTTLMSLYNGVLKQTQGDGVVWFRRDAKLHASSQDFDQLIFISK